VSAPNGACGASAGPASLGAQCVPVVGAPLTEPCAQVREHLAEQLQAQGISIHFGAKPVEVQKVGEGQLRLQTEGGDVWEGSHVMFATGRRPNIAGLGLEAVGVEVDKKRAIKVDAYSRTSVDNIWAVGDVTDRINLTPVALMEGMAYAKTAFLGQPTKPDHTNVPSAGQPQRPNG
jgi:glutathione reductase (NADPH)